MVRLLEQGAACDLCGGGQEVPSAYFDQSDTELSSPSPVKTAA